MSTMWAFPWAYPQNRWFPIGKIPIWMMTGGSLMAWPQHGAKTFRELLFDAVLLQISRGRVLWDFPDVLVDFPLKQRGYLLSSSK